MCGLEVNLLLFQGAIEHEELYHGTEETLTQDQLR